MIFVDIVTGAIPERNAPFVVPPSGGAPHYQPKALKVVSTSGLERVLVFKDVILNRADKRQAANLDRPNLNGYRKVSSDPLSP